MDYLGSIQSSSMNDGSAEEVSDLEIDDSSSTSTITSVLDKLRPPKLSDLARK